MILLSENFPDEQQFESTVNRILQRPGYRYLQNVFSDIIEKIKDTIARWIESLLNSTFSTLQNASEISGNLSVIFITAALLIMAGIIITIIVKTSRAFEKRKKVKEILGEKLEEGTTPESLKARASSFESKGDYRQAVRYGFIALLLFMHNRNLLYLDDTKTNEEIYSNLKKLNFKGLKVMKLAMDLFNSSWYGHKTFNSESYIGWTEELNLLWNEVVEYETENK
jgi:hypothetical protein